MLQKRLGKVVRVYAQEVEDQNEWTGNLSLTYTASGLKKYLGRKENESIGGWTSMHSWMDPLS